MRDLGCCLRIFLLNALRHPKHVKTVVFICDIMLDEDRGQQDCSATHLGHHFGCYHFQSIVMLMTECAVKVMLMSGRGHTISVTRMRERGTPPVGQLILQELICLLLQVR